VESSAFLIARRLEQLGVADSTLTRHADKIAAEVRGANKTINDLLELARNRPLQRRPVKGHDFLAQAVAAAHLPATVDVAINVPADLVLDADPDQLARVMTNLLINASQAMEGKGHVWVEGRREGATSVLVVRDDGPGVPPEVSGRIFEALFTTKAKGSGLGLALCRRIAEAHGGTLTLEPSTTGAAFKVIVPDA
jgi:signal transduction histidine kinase